MHGGMSQLAVPSPGIFYPPNLLFAYFDYSVVVGAISLFQQLVALLGAFLLVSSWGIAPACACGMIFALSGYMFTLNANHTLPATAAWIPLCWWLLRQTIEQKHRLLCCVLSAFFIFLLIAAGRPEIYMPALVLLAVSIAAEALVFEYRTNNEIKAFDRQVLLAAVGRMQWPCASLALGIMLAAPCLAPVAEWTALSPRAEGLNFQQALSWSANWYDLVCMAFNRPLGDLQILGAPHLESVATRLGYLQYMPSAYVGAVALTLAFIGFTDKSWRFRSLTFAGLLVVLIFSLGRYTPVVPFLMTVFPKLIVLRYPVKLLVFLDLLIAVWAARGIKVCLEDGVGKRASYIIGGIWLFGVLCGLFFWLINPSVNLAHVVLNNPGQRLLGKSILFGSLIGLVTILVARKLRNTPERLVWALLAALLGSLMAGAFTQAQKTCERGFYEQPSLVAQEVEKVIGDRTVKGRGRLLPLYFDPLSVPESYKGRTNSAPSEPFFQFCRQLLLPNIHVAFRIPQAFGYESAETSDYRQVVLNGIKSAGQYELSDSRNCVQLAKVCKVTSTAVLTRQRKRRDVEVCKLNEKYFELLRDIDEMNVRIYKVREPLPRAYVSHSWIWIDEQKSAEDLISEPTWRFNPARVTLIERRDYIDAQSSNERPAGGNYIAPIGDPPVKSPISIESLSESAGSPLKEAAFLQDESEHVAVSVNLDSPGFVVLNDHFYPGWQAQVDGVPVKVYRANGIMRAVYVPKGAHLVAFDYKPKSLSLSLMVSGFALSILALICLVLLQRPAWRLILLLSGR